jgi:hypothetical protein
LRCLDLGLVRLASASGAIRVLAVEERAVLSGVGPRIRLDGAVSRPSLISKSPAAGEPWPSTTSATVVGETNAIASNSCSDMDGSNRRSPISARSSRSMCATRS